MLQSLASWLRGDKGHEGLRQNGSPRFVCGPNSANFIEDSRERVAILAARGRRQSGDARLSDEPSRECCDFFLALDHSIVSELNREPINDRHRCDVVLFASWIVPMLAADLKLMRRQHS